jgi:hypothetical protein
VDWLVEANVSEKHTVSLPATLYNPSDSQHGHFSPEDGDSTLLQYVGFYQPVHTASKPRRTSLIMRSIFETEYKSLSTSHMRHTKKCLNFILF